MQPRAPAIHMGHNQGVDSDPGSGESHVASDAITPPSSGEVLLEIRASPPPPPTMSQLSFKGHTVIVTGAGGGLGKVYGCIYASMASSALTLAR